MASLPLPRARRLALLSAAIAAVALWPVHQSRYALRASLLPLWVALLLWAWWRATTVLEARAGRPSLADAREGQDSTGPGSLGRSLAWAVLAGLALGAAIHTHLSGRLLPVVPFVSAAGLAWRVRGWRPLAPLLVTLGLALALAWPQVRYFREHAEMLTYRAAQVSLLNPELNEGRPLAMLAANAGRIAAAPLWRGDDQWYHNVAERPVFPGAMALVFGLGTWVLLRRLWRSGDPRRGPLALLLATTAAVTLAPSLLSGAAPNFIRLTGAWPWLWLLPAIGLDALARGLRKRLSCIGRVLSPAAVGLLVGLFTLGTVRDYFGVYAGREEVYRVFNALAVERGYQVAEVAREGPTVVSPLLWRQSVIRFTNAAAAPEVAAVGPGSGLLLPAGAGEVGDGALRYLFDPLEPEATEGFAHRWPQAERETLVNGAGGPSLSILRVSPAALPGPTHVVSATFGDARLVGLRWDEASWAAGAPPHEAPVLTLHLRALGPTASDHNLFVRLLDARGAELGGWDGPPLAGSLPTDRWRADMGLRLDVPLAPPADAPSGPPAALRLGFYDWRDGARLPLPGVADGALRVDLDGRDEDEG